MLPSGNDAAMVLAQNLGAFLFYEKEGKKEVFLSCSRVERGIRYVDVTSHVWYLMLYVEYFVKSMNFKCRQLNLNNTHFINPHGMDPPNRL